MTVNEGKAVDGQAGTVSAQGPMVQVSGVALQNAYDAFADVKGRVVSYCKKRLEGVDTRFEEWNTAYREMMAKYWNGALNDVSSTENGEELKRARGRYAIPDSL